MRFAFGVEYDGTSFSGWQIQKNVRTIQGELAKALSSVANDNIIPIGAGRTDSGVHASGQIGHFDTDVSRTPFQWRAGVNTILPKDVSVQWVRLVDDNFHARDQANCRTYRYNILNQIYRSALNERYAWLIMQDLDDSLMIDALGHLEGKHNFSCFRASGCQAKTPLRHMYSASLTRKERLISIELRANAFLYHMVRNIMGSVIQVGLKKMPPDWIEVLLKSKDRELAGPTAPPQGLCLEKVEFLNYSFS